GDLSPVFCGSQTSGVFEALGKVALIEKASPHGDVDQPFFRIGQQPPGLLDSHRQQVFSRRHPEDGTEQAIEMSRREPTAAGKFRHRQRLAKVLLYEPDGWRQLAEPLLLVV